MFPESNYTKFWSHSLDSLTVEVPQELGHKKTNKKNGVISLVFISPSWVMVFKLSKIVLLAIFC